MSRKSNVNPDHYKLRGRDRQGEDIRQAAERQRLAKAEERATRGGAAGRRGRTGRTRAR
ncbi:MAG TPA: hypothetical protein VIL25_09485 [Vicinamibacterales bacterium]